MRKLILFCFILLSGSSLAQISVSFYPFSPSQLGLSTNPEKRIYGEVRTEVNTFFTNMNTEASASINILRTDTLNWFTSVGVSVNPAYYGSIVGLVNGYFISTGVRVKPFVKNRNIQVLFELSPYINRYLTSGNLRARLGLGYAFMKRAK